MATTRVTWRACRPWWSRRRCRRGTRSSRRPDARGIPVLKRATALGALVNRGRVIAVAGTHGKTTTTGMIGASLAEAGLDPTAFVGGRVPGWRGGLRAGWRPVRGGGRRVRPLLPGAPARPGRGDQPRAGPHGDLRGAGRALRCVRGVPEPVPDDGLIAVCADDAGAAAVAPGGRRPGPDLRPEAARASGPWTSRLRRTTPASPPSRTARPWASTGSGCQVTTTSGTPWPRWPSRPAGRGPDAVRRGSPGSAASSVASSSWASTGASSWSTTTPTTPRRWRPRWRRPGSASPRRLVAVFQPHLYTRTRELWREFGSRWPTADAVWVTDVFPAREAPIEG
jgi:UDP-N-acetylmuramate--alanine ligase